MSHQRGRKAVDCLGQTLGKWTVLSRAGRVADSATWHCVDLIGNRRILSRRELRNHKRTWDRNHARLEAANG